MAGSLAQYQLCSPKRMCARAKRYQERPRENTAFGGPRVWERTDQVADMTADLQLLELGENKSPAAEATVLSGYGSSMRPAEKPAADTECMANTASGR